MTTYKEIMAEIYKLEKMIDEYTDETEYELNMLLDYAEKRIYNNIHHKAYLFADRLGFEGWEELQEYNRREALRATQEIWGKDFWPVKEK